MRLKSLSECYSIVAARSQHYLRSNVPRYYTTIKDAKPFESIPGLSRLPIIGPLHHFLPVIGEFSLNTSFFDLAGKLHKKYGPIIRMTGVFARADMVMLFDPEYIEQSRWKQVAQNRSYGISLGEAYLYPTVESSTVGYRSQETNPLRPGFETAVHYREVLKADQYSGIYGLTTAQGTKWRDFRTKVNPALLKLKLVRVYSPGLTNIAQDFVDRLKVLKNDEAYLTEKFDYEIAKWSLESIALVGLGDRLGCLEGELPPEHPAPQLMKAAQDIIKLSYQLELLPHPWKYISTPGYKKLMKAYDVQWDISTMYIERARKRIEERGYDTHDEDKSIIEKLLAIDERVAIMMANEMLLAGIDTVAFTTISLLYHLAINPEKQEKLRKEIRSEDPQRRYLRACLKETQRIWHVVPANLRRTDKDHVVGGYHIPAGIDVIAPNELLSTMEKYYPQAKEFIPERWLSDKSDPLYYGNTHAMVTLPFGFGIRSCIGRRIAELEIEILIRNLINQFNVRWEGRSIKVVNRVTNVFEKPFNFKFEPASPK